MSATTRGRALSGRHAPACSRYRYGLAWIDDLVQSGAEQRFAPWRAELWRRVRGPRVLEIGVGTGRSMAHYPAGPAVTAVDLSRAMLRGARRRATREGVPVALVQADAQRLPFGDATFDAVVATFVFCSVPDAVLGLREARRVLAPRGQLLLLEHVISTRLLLRQTMRLASPLLSRLMDASVDRETVANARAAGFADVRAEDLWLDVVKLIEGRAPA